MKSALVRAVIGLLALTCLSVVPAEARAPLPAKCDDRQSSAVTPVEGAVLNDPTGETEDQYRILSAVRSNIAGTPPGGIIRIATLAINTQKTVKALLRAHDCRVGVRIIVPGRAWRDPVVVELRRALGTDVTRRSWITSCDGTCTRVGDEGIMHAKLYMFSEVGEAEDVTIYSSSNLIHSQATLRYNDAYQIVGNRGSYDSARAYFTTMKGNEEAEFPELTSTPGYRQYYFPASLDFHPDVFQHTRCGTDDEPTRVEFAISIWKRLDIIPMLDDLREAGCIVRIVVALDKIDRDVLEGLFRREIPTRVQSVDEGDQATHSKFIAIQGRHRGKDVSTVYSGSLNASKYSARVAENTMLRVVDDQVTYDAYHQAFEVLWQRSRPLEESDVNSAERLDAAAAERRS